MNDIDLLRRRLLAHFAAVGVGAGPLSRVLSENIQQSDAQAVTKDMLRGALVIAGLDFNDQDQEEILEDINRYLQQFKDTRDTHISTDISPPFYFSAIVPGMAINTARERFRMSAPQVRRPANLQDVAFWPVTNLARLIKTRQATSVELTEMYLARLKKYGLREKLNCVVTLLEERALAQAQRADIELATGRCRGPLHGIPWGVKDLFAVKGYKTTWGSSIYKDQMFEYDATAVELLDRAGAVLVAKLATSELAAGDDWWFGGQTRNPWNPSQGSGGSSAGPASATAAGLVGFSLGTETAGSIIYPSSRCGITGLRPTFGRVSRYGVMVLSWTLDRPGPMCRSAEDCAVVMTVITGVDGRDLSVAEIPFSWNAKSDVRKLKVGYLKDAFDEVTDAEARERNDMLLDQVKALGLSPIPLRVPEIVCDMSVISIESGAFFDELIRSGEDRQIRDSARDDRVRSARLIPAAEYLQSQRIRMIAMMRLREATRDVDVYFGPIDILDDGRVVSGQAASRHSTLANIATYPALALPCGFTDAGMPVAVTFFAPPFCEDKLLKFGKAYQDTTNFHLKHPDLQG